MAKKYHGKMGGGRCGLPEKPMMKDYPKSFKGAPEPYADGREAIDEQTKAAQSKMFGKPYKR